MYSSSSQSHERKSRHWGPDGRALASRRRFHVCHFVTLQSLFSIRKRKASSRKRRSHERERATHTHTQRGEKKRNTEDKMAFIRTAAEGHRSLIFPLIQLFSSFPAAFISPARHAVARRVLRSHKKMFTPAPRVPVISPLCGIVCKST